MSDAFKREAPKSAIIFAGGKGTRMAELTHSVPKPGVEVCGRPLITYVIDSFLAAGVQRIIIAAGYKQLTLKRLLKDHYELFSDVRISREKVQSSGTGLPQNVEIIISDTGPESETAERILACKKYLPADEEAFFVTYGDTVTDLDLNQVSTHFCQSGDAGIVTIGFPDGRYGEVESEDGYITRFKEKERPKFYVNRGFMILTAAMLDAPLFRNARSLEQDILPVLAEEKKLAAFKTDANFISVDSVRDLAHLEDSITNGSFRVMSPLAD